MYDACIRDEQAAVFSAAHQLWVALYADLQLAVEHSAAVRKTKAGRLTFTHDLVNNSLWLRYVCFCPQLLFALNCLPSIVCPQLFALN